MADPLSVTASITALITTGQTCVTLLVELIKSVQNAPAEIQALSNELTDLGIFFNNVQELCENIDTDDTQRSRFLATASKPLEAAREALAELEGLLNESKSQPLSAKRRLKWTLQRGTVKKLREKFQKIKSDLMAVLTLSTAAATSRLSKIEIRLESLQSNSSVAQLPFATSPTASSLHILQHQVEGNLVSPSEISSIEVKRQRRPDNSTAKYGIDVLTSAASSTPSSTTQMADPQCDPNPNPVAGDVTQAIKVLSSETTICFQVSRRRRCKVSCECACHSTQTYRTPPLLKKFIGTLFLGYAGSPIFAAKCSVVTCHNPIQGSVELVYCFPSWFCQRALQVSAALSSSLGTTIQIRVRRRIPWGGGQDTLLRFALTGNVDGAKSFIASGKALLTDTDPNHGRTALHYAVLRNKIEVCKFLLEEGADPHLQDDHGITASQKAWEQILCRRGTAAEIQGFERLFPGAEELENYEFSYLHKVVVGIYPMSLAVELQNQQYRDQVTLSDSMKRTALHWAAIRADEAAVRCLLEAGSDVNARDDFNATPLTLAASTGSIPILESLILHGADVHARTSIGSQAIHHASRHQKDIAPVQTLLRAGASLQSINNMGHSPLSGAAISNRHEIGVFLLDKGANMHVRSLHGDTPLFETIFHNSHEFLQLLMDRGANLFDINNAGSTVLHAAALEADTRTIEILQASEVEKSQCCVRDRNGHTAPEIAQSRTNPPRGFVEAFEQLVGTTSEER
ncbi:Ankyrin repeat-containing protein [Cladophialophora immunda]|nr:Ankyrin repeat-containing protein [Cladophialophora immunda]